MSALHDLQASFAAALRGGLQGVDDWAAGDGIPAAARLCVYRNNSQALFEQALEWTFPVLRQRVGDAYFRQLAHSFRAGHPSPAGDLHEIGRRFDAFLAGHLAGGPYAWLAELARLEWAVADAAVAADATPVPVTALAGFEPRALEELRLEFVPSLRRVAATVPVLTVWRANRPGVAASAVDLATGPEQVVVHRCSDGVQMRGVERDEFEFITALDTGATLGRAVEHAALALERLPGLLRWMFTDGAVSSVTASAPGTSAAR